MKIKVLNIEGKETGKEVDLSDAIFGVEPNEHAVYLASKQFMANQRQGTHKSKERAEIAGSTKKIKKQKGTGTARAGSIKNPLFRGGGRVFGPRPRNYGFKLNKKLKLVARNSVLSEKAKNGGLLVVEDFNFDAPQTKEFARILSNLGASDKNALLLLGEKNDNLYLSSRNIASAEVREAFKVNTYEVLRSQVLILSESSVPVINELSN